MLAARARGHEVTVADPTDCQIVIMRGRPGLMMHAEPLGRVDMVLPRIGASITGYGLAVVRQLDMMGVPTLNGSLPIARSRDKLRAMQLLTAKRLDVPRTVYIKSTQTIDRALKFVGGLPVIIKLSHGTQGIGTMIADSRQGVTSVVDTLLSMGHEVLIQEYVAESSGQDFRAFVVGRRVVAAMRREAPEGDFRSNIHRGGIGFGIELDDVYRKAALSAARAVGLEIAGVDMLKSKHGPKIIEINSSPGLEGIERATGIDVAKQIVTYAERFAKRRRDEASSKISETRSRRLRDSGFFDWGTPHAPDR